MIHLGTSHSTAMKGSNMEWWKSQPKNCIVGLDMGDKACLSNSLYRINRLGEAGFTPDKPDPECTGGTPVMLRL